MLKCWLSRWAKIKQASKQNCRVLCRQFPTSPTNKSTPVCQPVTFGGRRKQRVVSTFMNRMHVVPRVLTRVHADVAPHFMLVVFVWVQKSHGNGPLNRLLMAAKRKYMETELPPQESEGKNKNKTKQSEVSSFLTSALLHLLSMACKPGRCQSCHMCILLTSSGTYRMISLLVSPWLSVDLFQDLSQLQETWLTEGEFSLYMFFPLFF